MDDEKKDSVINSKSSDDIEEIQEPEIVKKDTDLKEWEKEHEEDLDEYKHMHPEHAKKESEYKTETDKEDTSDDGGDDKDDFEEYNHNQDRGVSDVQDESRIRFRGFNPNDKSSVDDIFSSRIAPRKTSMKKFLIFLIVLAVIALGVGWFATTVFFQGESNETSKQEIVQVSPIPVAATPTPMPQLNKEEWSFEILNGTTVSGSAKKIADSLKEKGYTVVKTGNADNNEYEITKIMVSDNLSSKVDLLITDISDIIKIATVSGSLEGSTPSARIIIGSDTAN
jgi:hypothetical protein